MQACDRDQQCGAGMCCAVSLWIRSLRMCTPMGNVGDECHPLSHRVSTSPGGWRDVLSSTAHGTKPRPGGKAGKLPIPYNIQHLHLSGSRDEGTYVRKCISVRIMLKGIRG